MPKIIHLEQILSVIDDIDIIEAMKTGFIEYSNGNSVVPPVGELLFQEPPGDVHIKYGYIKKQEHYVIKIASGFYENSALGIPSGQGLMLLFKQQTGELEAVILDEGLLTNIRTVAAGALAVKHFSPNDANTVGIIGTGTIAKMQIEFLKQHQLASNFCLWGRNHSKAKALCASLGTDYSIRLVDSCTELARHSNAILTTTPSESPLLLEKDIKEGTLLVAIGSDTHNKQELDAAILQKANVIIADSIPQSKSRGEIFQAVKANAINEQEIIELGHALQRQDLQALDKNQIVVVDLTGVAVQDIMIASAVYNQINK